LAKPRPLIARADPGRKAGPGKKLQAVSAFPGTTSMSLFKTTTAVALAPSGTLEYGPICMVAPAPEWDRIRRAFLAQQGRHRANLRS
jgi:hypothetical protein